MVAILNFYLDDSGTRHPDRQSTDNKATKDWFALGGVLIRDSDEAEARLAHEKFCTYWGIKYPLHSVDIRNNAKDFQWIRKLSDAERTRFFRMIERFLLGIPAIGIACVIDRPGYNHRYVKKYGRQRWALCKTAFYIVVERAAKYAMAQSLKLRVIPERCTKKDDEKLAEYYADMKARGAPFDATNSGKYSPLGAESLANVLYELRFKSKSSPMMQVADLYLWPMCMGGYDKTNHPYRRLIETGRLMDCQCPEKDVAELGIKYSCFDLVTPKT